LNMQNTFDPKIKTIMNALHARGFTLKGIRQGIRLKLEDGIDVDIYTLKFDANKLRARLKLHIGDKQERSRIIRHVTDILEEGLSDTSEVEEFKFSRCISGDYYYYARLFMLDMDFIQKPPDQRTDIMVARRGAADTNDINVEQTSDLLKVVDIFESVDSKMFRQALDDLGLSRTSILRVSLTRIFRSAADADELKAAIREEALRIADPADRTELDSILTSNYVEFLDPVIRMLHQSVFDDPDMEVAITDL